MLIMSKDRLGKFQKGHYPLEWFEEVVTISLDPEKVIEEEIPMDMIESMTSRMQSEYDKLRLAIKTQVFVTGTDQEITAMIRRYHYSIITLLDQTSENQKRIEKKSRVISQILLRIASCLDQLLSFLERRFRNYLSQDERAPTIFLVSARNDIMRSVTVLKRKVQSLQQIRPVFDLIFKRIHRFFDDDHREFELTYRALIYKRKFIQKLEEIDWSKTEKEITWALHETLIYMNFNSKTYFELLTASILEHVNTGVDLAQQLENLLFLHKEFRQLHRKNDVILNPNAEALHVSLENWFSQEVQYREKRSQLPLPMGMRVNTPTPKTVPEPVKNKITFNLSTDQLGLIIRAADESRLVSAKSLSEVYRTIVPHLSTQHAENPSYKTMRSKAYTAEDRDKEKAIMILEKMIIKIKNF